MQTLESVTDKFGGVPLSFVAAPVGRSYTNLGDALSPVMVSIVSGRQTVHVPHKADMPRLAAVGTIAHSFEKGDVWVWGTGCSRYRNPLDGQDRQPFDPSAARFHVHATRGPVSRALLKAEGGRAVYGDPVWLLPKFHKRPTKRRWKLGVIVHLSDLADRSHEANTKDGHLRYDVPESLKNDVRIFNTVTPVTVEGLRERLDDILSCERIVSTSLHGMVFAESYGIPCLYFSPRGAKPGLNVVDLDPEGKLDLRIVDLYRGIGLEKLPVYAQERRQATDWEALMRTVDAAWEPKSFDTDPLVESFPLGANPITPPADGNVFGHPLIQSIPLWTAGALEMIAPGRFPGQALNGRLDRLLRIFRPKAS